MICSASVKATDGEDRPGLVSWTALPAGFRRSTSYSSSCSPMGTPWLWPSTQSSSPPLRVRRIQVMVTGSREAPEKRSGLGIVPVRGFRPEDR